MQHACAEPRKRRRRRQSRNADSSQLPVATTLTVSYVFRKRADAEAAFKKLTAAFEKLHDPVQQARCRAEVERVASRSYKRNPSAHSGAGSSSHTPVTRPSGGDGGGGGAASRAGGGDAPRWCREGEYVPEKKRGEETPETGKRKVCLSHPIFGQCATFSKLR